MKVLKAAALPVFEPPPKGAPGAPVTERKSAVIPKTGGTADVIVRPELCSGFILFKKGKEK